MPKRSEPDFDGIPVATSNFWTTDARGHRLMVHAGEAWAADDPIVRANPEKFIPLRIHSSKGTSVELVVPDNAGTTSRREAATVTA